MIRIALTLGLALALLSGCAAPAPRNRPMAVSVPVQGPAPPANSAHHTFVADARGEPVSVDLLSNRDVPLSYRRARYLERWEISGAFERTISYSQTVPNFQLVDFERGDAPQDLVGKEAFVVVFFATWCELCVKKIETVQIATSRVPGAKLLFVSVDDETTKSHVAGFMREQRLEEIPVVDGLENPAFLASYNPSSSLPLVTVVGKAGDLIVSQIGLVFGDGQRLERALEIALH